MSVKETNQGTWQVRWREANGRQRARTFSTRALAERHERQIRASIDQGVATSAPADGVEPR